MKEGGSRPYFITKDIFDKDINMADSKGNKIFLEILDISNHLDIKEIEKIAGVDNTQIA